MTSLALHPALAVRRAPWYLVALPLACAAGMLLPIVYLIVRASQADAGLLRDVVFRPRTFSLLLNTVELAGAVLVMVTLLGVPMAWLTTRCDLRARRWLTLLAVLPLAVPGYLMAYTLLSLGGPRGTVQQLLGFEWPRMSGFLGAWIALSLYNLPYMFLNLRVAMQRMDPALEETARSLGLGPLRVFFRVILPQLRPSLWAGGLLVVLHVLGDFGVVSLTRFETFSFALYQQVESNDRPGAAWLGLMLVAITLALLIVELRFLRGLRLDPAGMAATRVRRPIRLGRWSIAAYGFLLTVAALSLFVPLGTILFWCTRATVVGKEWGEAFVETISVALPAAAITTALAIPMAYLARRYPSPLSRGLERCAYIGYATPALAFAMGFVFFGLHGAPALYQTFVVLIAAYALHFLAEAIGPIRSALYVATPRVEEAARSLGCGRWAAFTRVTLPILRPGIVVSAALVFLSVVKELPITYILSPPGFQGLAMRVWDHTNEVEFAKAAPYAMTILMVSAVFVGLVLTRGYEDRGSAK